MRSRPLAACALAVIAIGAASCATPVQPTASPAAASASMAQLWERPVNLAARDLYNGPWGAALAPDPDAVYRLKHPKQGGINPGVVVEDPQGREWHVKQPPGTDEGAEGPVEVTLSRVLSGVGYHQPPVYFLRDFKMQTPFGLDRAPGGRFRVSVKQIKAEGTWSWQSNPFVGTPPYQGLLVILTMFNASDLKNDNNTLYRVHAGDMKTTWFVVRDLGTALGETGRVSPKRNDPDIFAREPFITGVSGGFVQFNYRGRHQELLRDRITPADVGWASSLLSGLSERQWQDAFRAGGYTPEAADRFIGTLRAKIAEGLRVAEAYGPTGRGSR